MLLQHAALRLSAWYLRNFDFSTGRWRLVRFAVDQSKRHGSKLGRRIVTTKYGFRLDLDVGDWLGQHVYATGSYEDYTARVLSEFVSPGDVALDIGANVGFFSLLLATKVTSAGQVIAFEPAPSIREELNRNIELNGLENVTVRREALTIESGVARFQVGPSDHRGTSSLRSGVESPSETIEVPTATLDSLLDEQTRKRVTLMKIDIEGAEHNALKGMTQLISEQQPSIVIEMSDHFLREFGSSSENVYSDLRDLGYRAFRIDWNGLRPIEAWDPNLPVQFNALFTARKDLPRSLNIQAS